MRNRRIILEKEAGRGRHGNERKNKEKRAGNNLKYNTEKVTR